MAEFYGTTPEECSALRTGALARCEFIAVISHRRSEMTGKTLSPKGSECGLAIATRPPFHAVETIRETLKDR